jgi:hypothetical protein
MYINFRDNRSDKVKLSGVRAFYKCVLCNFPYRIEFDTRVWQN